MRLAASMTDARELTVVTNGPDTFAALQDRPGVTPSSPADGSTARPAASSGRSPVGRPRSSPSTASSPPRPPIDPRAGATEATLDEADVKRALAAGAREVVLAVDASKLEQRGVAVALDWDTIDVLVTELDPGDARLTRYRSLARIL